MPRPTVIAREPGIALDVVAAVQRALHEQGFDRDIPEGDPIVPGSIADRLFDDAAEALGHDAVSVTTAQRVPICGLGTMDYAMCTSATLGDAMRRVTEHYGVATQRVQLELVQDGARAALVCHRGAGLAHSRHWIEFAFAVIAQRTRDTLGADVVFTDVSFAHAEAKHHEVHDRFFGVPVAFGAEVERMGFDAALLDRSLRTASRTLATLLETRIREVSPVPPFIDRVQRALAEMLDARQTDVGQLAARMNVSTRSLQRELLGAGLTFSAMLDQIRRERAFALLDQGALVADVAHRLGFSAPSAFFRAYRRWTGTSPKASRR